MTAGRCGTLFTLPAWNRRSRPFGAASPELQQVGQVLAAERAPANLYVVLFFVAEKYATGIGCRLIGCSEKTELEETLTTLEEDDGCEPKQMRSSLTGFHTPSLKSSKQSCAIISCRKCQFIHSLTRLFIYLFLHLSWQCCRSQPTGGVPRPARLR